MLCRLVSEQRALVVETRDHAVGNLHSSHMAGPGLVHGMPQTRPVITVERDAAAGPAQGAERRQQFGPVVCRQNRQRNATDADEIAAVEA